MPLIEYVPRRFSYASAEMIEQANDIITKYQDAGYVLTLRQLYYQFVSRDLLPNTIANYKRLGSVVNDARLAGLIDWHAIEDRTRNLASLSHWNTPADVINSAAASYRLDKWVDQKFRVEVWIEKEALAGVFERACSELDVPFLCCRGYTSQSEMWGASQRMLRYAEHGHSVRVLHFGDHDPSGIDMSRDIVDRLKIFGVDMQFDRLALNMDQIRKHKPPPNPAKETDSRFAGYIAKYGSSSWELDALEPQVLSALVTNEVMSLVDKPAWRTTLEIEKTDKALLNLASTKWPKVEKFLKRKTK